VVAAAIHENIRHSGKIAFLLAKMRFYPESHLVLLRRKKQMGFRTNVHFAKSKKHVLRNDKSFYGWQIL
jgi:hypothetical protein